MTAAATNSDRAQRNTAVVAGVIGNIVEWYDFALYGFMASVISELFFPSDDHLVSLIATYGVFAAGFVMRPLGSVVFGWLGDTLGRSRTLLLSVAMMAVPTLLLGLLPSYASIGVLAPLALVVVRMVQGLSVGGEFSTSVTYLVETASPNRRGIAGSWANIGSLGGMLLGSAAAAAATNLMTPETLATWGWRVPFLFGGVLGSVAVLMRRKLPESPHFRGYEGARCPNSPLREAFVCNRAQMAQGTLFAAAYGALFYLALVYLPTWVGEVSGIPLAVGMQANTATLALLLPLIPLAGWVSDRYVGRTRLVAAAFLVLGFLGAAMFVWMRGGGVVAVIVGQLSMGVVLAVPLGVAPALFTELFPEEDRLTGYSIVFNVGLGIVGGLTPMLASWLILSTGLDLAPVGVLATAAAVGVAGLLWMRDGSREPLRTSCRLPLHQAAAVPAQSFTERG
jgi:MHS family proline/betaine transporter-like MFS transporter